MTSTEASDHVERPCDAGNAQSCCGRLSGGPPSSSVSGKVTRAPKRTESNLLSRVHGALGPQPSAGARPQYASAPERTARWVVLPREVGRKPARQAWLMAKRDRAPDRNIHQYLRTGSAGSAQPAARIAGRRPSRGLAVVVGEHRKRCKTKPAAGIGGRSLERSCGSSASWGYGWAP